MAGAAATELARLRVAQATYTPKTAAMIAEELEADDPSASLSEAQVGDVLAEWEAAGVVEALPSSVEGEPERYFRRPVFEHDMERRIVANLSQPRTVESLQAMLRTDENVGPLPIETLNAYLDALAGRGLVASVGEHEDGASLAAAVQEHPETLDLPDEKAQALVERLEVPSRAWQLAGEQWAMTNFAHDVLRVT